MVVYYDKIELFELFELFEVAGIFPVDCAD